MSIGLAIQFRSFEVWGLMHREWCSEDFEFYTHFWPHLDVLECIWKPWLIALSTNLGHENLLSIGLAIQFRSFEAWCRGRGGMNNLNSIPIFGHIWTFFVHVWMLQLMAFRMTLDLEIFWVLVLQFNFGILRLHMRGAEWTIWFIAPAQFIPLLNASYCGPYMQSCSPNPSYPSFIPNSSSVSLSPFVPAALLCFQ